ATGTRSSGSRPWPCPACGHGSRCRSTRRSGGRTVRRHTLHPTGEGGLPSWHPSGVRVLRGSGERGEDAGPPGAPQSRPRVRARLPLPEAPPILAVAHLPPARGRMATTISAPPGPVRFRVLAGFLFALGAGTLWGTTGPLSTALYSVGAELTAVGFWRILLATLGFIVYGLFARSLFRIDRRGLVLVGLVGGALVALFEVAYQFAIQGVGVAGAATLLYTAPIMVAVLARPLLGERLTVPRVVLAVVVLVGVAMTVSGHV